MDVGVWGEGSHRGTEKEDLGERREGKLLLGRKN